MEAGEERPQREVLRRKSSISESTSFRKDSKVSGQGLGSLTSVTLQEPLQKRAGGGLGVTEGRGSQDSSQWPIPEEREGREGRCYLTTDGGFRGHSGGCGVSESERCSQMELPEPVCRGEDAGGEGLVEDRYERRLLLMEQSVRGDSGLDVLALERRTARLF